jgi:hypothetical protein
VKEKFFRNETQEVKFHEYLSAIPLFSSPLTPYPVTKVGSFLNYEQDKEQNYSNEYIEKIRTEWLALIKNNEQTGDDVLIIDIYIKDNNRNLIHGSGTGMYGLMFSAFTLGIVPSYFTYDYNTEVTLKNTKGEVLESQKMAREGSQTGSVFLYLHSNHISLFSEQWPFEVLDKWPIQRMIGHQIKKSVQSYCSREGK